MKTFFKIMGASAFVAGAYLYSRKETPAEFIARTKKTLQAQKEAVSDWQTAYTDFKKSMAHFKDQLPELTSTINALQRDIDEAMFQIQPRVDEINKVTSKMGKSDN
ncbi:hypothetical protein [Lentilactobacillus kisonensis]|nr:hypothetical protein [Lentilactobacillus kisonensis]KRL23541.1 hypothetical protein FC98_GL000269 [Lentilactobacillus kisonensis DSM 19906 = JCM 15041]